MASATKIWEKQIAVNEQHSLYEQLKETWPCEVVEPYGMVLIIPAKVFRNEWREQLEKEGAKIYSQGYHGETCFFLKANSEGKETHEKLKRRRWTSLEDQRLRELHGKGLSFKQIGKELNRSRHSIMHKVQALGLGKASLKAQHTKQDKPSIETKNCSLEDDVVKELLAACSVLYPQYRNATAILLREASNKILEAK